MSNLFDRLNKELEDFGRKAQSAFDEGRVRLDLMRLRRKLDNAARDLGLLVHQRERGGDVDESMIDGLLTRLDETKARIDGLEEEIRAARAASSVHEQPAPDAQTGEAEVVMEEAGEAEETGEREGASGPSGTEAGPA